MTCLIDDLLVRSFGVLDSGKWLLWSKQYCGPHAVMLDMVVLERFAHEVENIWHVSFCVLPYEICCTKDVV